MTNKFNDNSHHSVSSGTPAYIPAAIFLGVTLSMAVGSCITEGIKPSKNSWFFNHNNSKPTSIESTEDSPANTDPAKLPETVPAPL